MKRLHAPIVAFLLPVLFLAACDFTYAEPDGPGVVGGIDLDPLFVAASSAEIEAIKADWQSRDTSVSGYQLEHSETATLAGAEMRVEIVSHLVTGQRHYGAILTPNGATMGNTPVLMYLHGGDAGISVDGEVGFILQFFVDLGDEFIVVIPSFRDESLRYNGQTWQSDGPPSPWNYDVDDAIALLNVAIETTPEADASRVASFGMSRGGAVAMLMGARDVRVDRIVEFFGPTDFFGPFVQDVATEALSGSPRNLPGVDYLNENYLLPLASGELTIQDLRPELVRRSAVLFVDDISMTQAHHGEADTVVPVTQAHLLMEAMDAAGKRAPDFEGFLYDGGEHNPITLPGAFDRAIEFLRPMVN
ncbi:MAG: dipeptidyl aminopeptidase/acylaminoacyl peptidase [Rhodothermales bacterium]|jgi:dipeptidyl aminopeptidase/acylaminoacyl peptidase